MSVDRIQHIVYRIYSNKRPGVYKFFTSKMGRLFEEGAYSGKALIIIFNPKGALIRGKRLFGGAYFSKYGTDFGFEDG